jgi:hypothetical protein
MTASSAIALARTHDRGGFYFRVGYNDHTGLCRLIAEGKLHADGMILDARRHERHEDLRRQASHAHIATCIDTQAMELALGASSKGHTELPWAAHAALPRAFTARRIEEFVSAIVRRVIEGDYAEVLAPTHYIGEIDSDWLRTDCALTSELRAQLDAADREDVRIIYPLAVHHSVFYSRASRTVLRRELRALPAVEAICLKVQPFGSESGPHVIKAFIEACWDLRDIDIPLMIGRSGLVGLSAFALGAVDAIESGITVGDSFDVASVRSAATGSSGFAPPQRVYLESLGMTVALDVATKLTGTSRGKLQFGCREQKCCRNEIDTLNDANRHSALARYRQYAALARVPPRMRADHFLGTMLTPVCDMLARASDAHAPFQKVHRRMLSVKEVLAELAEQRGQSQVATAHVPTRQKTAQVIQLHPRDLKGR